MLFIGQTFLWMRWVWASTARVYPELLRAGRRVDRCHDLELIERLLTSRDGEVSEGAEALAAGTAGSAGHGPGPERAAGAAAQGMLFEPPGDRLFRRLRNMGMNCDENRNC